MFKACLRIAAALVVFLPASAHADWLFTPSAGYGLGADALTRNPMFAFGITWLDEESFGLEAEAGFAPSFFDSDTDTFVGSGNLLSLMGNFVFGGPPGRRILPYVTGGAGYLRMHVTSEAGRFTSNTHEPAFNVGAGLHGFVGPAIGVRGDVRYFRSFRDQPPSWTRDVDLDIAPGSFDFWRASIGITIRVPE